MIPNVGIMEIAIVLVIALIGAYFAFDLGRFLGMIDGFFSCGTRAFEL